MWELRDPLQHPLVLRCESLAELRLCLHEMSLREVSAAMSVARIDELRGAREHSVVVGTVACEQREEALTAWGRQALVGGTELPAQAVREHNVRSRCAYHLAHEAADVLLLICAQLEPLQLSEKLAQPRHQYRGTSGHIDLSTRVTHTFERRGAEEHSVVVGTVACEQREETLTAWGRLGLIRTYLVYIFSVRCRGDCLKSPWRRVASACRRWLWPRRALATRALQTPCRHRLRTLGFPPSTCRLSGRAELWRAELWRAELWREELWHPMSPTRLHPPKRRQSRCQSHRGAPSMLFATLLSLQEQTVPSFSAMQGLRRRARAPRAKSFQSSTVATLRAVHRRASLKSWA